MLIVTIESRIHPHCGVLNKLPFPLESIHSKSRCTVFSFCSFLNHVPNKDMVIQSRTGIHFDFSINNHSGRAFVVLGGATCLRVFFFKYQAFEEPGGQWLCFLNQSSSFLPHLCHSKDKSNHVLVSPSFLFLWWWLHCCPLWPIIAWGPGTCKEDAITASFGSKFTSTLLAR